MFGGDIIGNLTGGLKNVHLKGSVALMRKNALDFNDFGATAMDSVTEFLGRGVTCQLISSTVVDSSEHSTTPEFPRPADAVLCECHTYVHICG
jgi:linoleate 9S-lipoxygenase